MMVADSTDAADDRTLARRAAAGDRAAFGALVERHYDRIFRTAWRLMGSRAEAEDLAQEVCARLGSAIRSYRAEAALTTWLTRLVLNAGRDQIRARSRQSRLAQVAAERDALVRAGDAARAESQAWLAQELEYLAPDLRETAALVVGEGLTHAAAAEILGVAEATVSWRLAQLRKTLRARLTVEER